MPTARNLNLGSDEIPVRPLRICCPRSSSMTQLVDSICSRSAGSVSNQADSSAWEEILMEEGRELTVCIIKGRRVHADLEITPQIDLNKLTRIKLD